MAFYEIRQLADDSHEIPCLFTLEFGKMSQNVSSAVVVMGT